jgi:DNA-binding MurR/RpiR family transcriptional regulator
MTLLERLKQDIFNENEQVIIDYINNNLIAVSSMTIGEIVKNTYSSNASIIRITHKLGCEGYKDFKYQLTKELESSKYAKQSIDFTVPFYTLEGTYDVIKNMSTLYKESIDIINASLNSQLIDEVIDVMYHCERMFIYAIGDTNITVKSFMNKLFKDNYYAINATEYHEETAMSQNVRKNDCVLFVTYAGLSDTYKQCLQIIKKSGCKIIVITANEKHYLIEQCDYKIILPNKEKDHKIATFYSQLAFQYILDIIFSLLHNKIQKSNL